MGWRHLQGDLDTPASTGRSSFAEVVQEATLRRQLQALNLRDGDGHPQPWLDQGRISQAVAAITRIPGHRLMEANRDATALLLGGITVDGVPGWDGGRGQTIHYIDWLQPERNEFTVVNQYRVDCPPGYSKAFIVPDLVLLVNGIPLVVVECKSPAVPEPLADAVDQLRRYSNQRRASGEVMDNEGNEPLFHTNQLLVATSFDEARVGSVGASFRHFAAWKTVVGADGQGTEAEVAAGLAAALGVQTGKLAGQALSEPLSEAPLQGGGGDRPQRPGKPTLGHRRADRGIGGHRHLGRRAAPPAAPQGAGPAVRHDPKITRQRPRQ